MEKRFTRDSEQKIQSIYKAFTELINDKGYENLTARQIAERANISVGTIYHYFRKGKPAIAAALYEKNLLETLDIKNITGYQTHDLKNQIKRHLELHKQNKELYRAFDQAIYSHSDIFRGVKRKRDQVLSQQLGDSDPRKLMDIMRVYLTVDAIIHKHLFVEPLFESDTELVKYLTKIAETVQRFTP